MTSKTWRSVTKYKKLSSMSDIRKGDVIVFKMSSSKGHVGIAISDSMMVDASSGQGEVVRRSFKTDYWRKSTAHIGFSKAFIHRERTAGALPKIYKEDSDGVYCALHSHPKSK